MLLYYDRHLIFQRRADMTDRATPDAAWDTTDLFEIMRTTRSMRRLKRRCRMDSSGRSWKRACVRRVAETCSAGGSW
jgi:hypothetical protein